MAIRPDSLETRVGGCDHPASGQTSAARSQTVANAMGCGGCGYKTASGRWRWLNRDPIGERGGINLYRFNRNNPLRWVDPHGLDPAFDGALDDLDSTGDAGYGESGAAITQTLVDSAWTGYFSAMAQIALSEGIGAALGAIGDALGLGVAADAVGLETPKPVPAPKVNPCPGEKPPVVIGRNMNGRVIPFAQQNGFDYYQPGPPGTPAENLAANQQWLQSMIDEGRTIIDIGPGLNNPTPSPYYNMESSLVSENSVPVVSFYGFK
jgi:RHS repeat-associated protein